MAKHIDSKRFCKLLATTSFVVLDGRATLAPRLAGQRGDVEPAGIDSLDVFEGNCDSEGGVSDVGDEGSLGDSLPERAVCMEGLRGLSLDAMDDGDGLRGAVGTGPGKQEWLQGPRYSQGGGVGQTQLGEECDDQMLVRPVLSTGCGSTFAVDPGVGPRWRGGRMILMG